MSLGKKITESRKRRGMKQEELGQIVGLTGASLSAYENDGLKGGPDIRTLIRIARALEDPSILSFYCDACPVRNEVFIRRYPELNNIERTPMVIFAKVIQELEEGADVLRPLVGKMMRKDFADCPDFAETLDHALMQLFGTEQALEILVHEALAKQILSPEKVLKKRQELQAHCVREGYHIPAKTGTEG
jgi:transcriptional regulator with XRE-family HTH domain